jgi:hypothetical protein
MIKYIIKLSIIDGRAGSSNDPLNLMHTPKPVHPFSCHWEGRKLRKEREIKRKY